MRPRGRATSTAIGAGALTAAAAALAALACAPPAPRSYEERVRETPPAARHGVQSDRLREIMQGLERLQRERLPQAMDVREERTTQVEEMARIALEIADSASRISASAAEAGLDPAARAEFDGYAAELARRTRALADEAPRLTAPELRERVRGVSQVCDSCHARFRIPLEPFTP